MKFELEWTGFWRSCRQHQPAYTGYEGEVPMPKRFIDDPPHVKCGGILFVEANSVRQAVENFKRCYRETDEFGDVKDYVTVVYCEPVI